MICRIKPKLAISLIFIALLASCKMEESKLQSALVDDTSCAAPCWNTIEPGSTSIEKTWPIIVGMPGVTLIEEDLDIVRERGRVMWYFPKETAEEYGLIRFQQDIVSEMEFEPKSVSLGELVDSIGPPDKIFIIYNRHETTWIWVDLLYPSRGIIIEYIDFHYCCGNTGYFDLKYDLEPTRVYYFDPVMYDEMLNDKVFTLDFVWVPDEELNKAIKDWEGFGLVEYKDLTELW